MVRWYFVGTYDCNGTLAYVVTTNIDCLSCETRWYGKVEAHNKQEALAKALELGRAKF